LLEHVQLTGQEGVSAGHIQYSTLNVGLSSGRLCRRAYRGYAIIEAADAESAKAMLAGHPYMGWKEASIEIMELMPIKM
jgi:hypothetical protein